MPGSPAHPRLNERTMTPHSEQAILALDAHGGDFGPEVLTAAALDALERTSGTDDGMEVQAGIGRPFG